MPYKMAVQLGACNAPYCDTRQDQNGKNTLHIISVLILSMASTMMQFTLFSCLLPSASSDTRWGPPHAFSSVQFNKGCSSSSSLG